MSHTTNIHFQYKGAQIHCGSDCGAPDTKSAVEAVDQALTAAGLSTFELPRVCGGTSVELSDKAVVGDSEADDSADEQDKNEGAAEAEAKAKADAKKKADAEAKAKKAADKKAADEKAAAKKKADEDAAEKAAQEEQASEEAGDGDEPAGDDKPDTITLEALRDQVMAFSQANGPATAKRLVQEVGGAEKISAVAKEKYAELYKAAGGEA